MPFYRDYFNLVDQGEPRAQLTQTGRMAKETDQVVEKTVNNSRQKLNAVARGVVAGYRMVEDLLGAFGIKIPPVLGALVSGIYPIVTAYTALAHAMATTGVGIPQAIALTAAIASLIISLIAAAASNLETEKALNAAKGMGQDVAGIANAFRYI